MPRRPDIQEDSLYQNCPLCCLPDSSQMVSCDECSRWYHFACAGVSEAITDYDWRCQGCNDARVPAPVTPMTSTQSPGNVVPTEPPLPHSFVPIIAGPRTMVSASPHAPLVSAAGPNARDAVSFGVLPTTLANSIVIESMPVVTNAASPATMNACRGRFSAPPIVPRTTPTMATVGLSQAPCDNFAAQLPVELRLRFLEEEQALERKHLMQRYQLLMEDSRNGPLNSVNNPVESPLPNAASALFTQPTPLPTQPPHIPTVGFATTSIDRNRQYQFSSVPNVEEVNRSLHAGFPFHSSPVQRPFTPNHHNVDPLSAIGVGSEMGVLNRSQIAARQAVSKDLPEFNGNPEQWPLFSATFDSTTRICGYTHEENMIRLQKCLKGKALEAVRCQLLHPGNLENVMATLKMLFGRPEIIINSLIQKIDSLPSPKSDKLNTLVDFAIAVRNLVATVQNCSLDEHLSNVSLLQNLVDRLPAMIRLNWATYRQGLHRVTLTHFSDWLYNLAEAASSVTIPQFFNSTEKSRHTRKDDGYLNTHTNSSINQLACSDVRGIKPQRCLVCKAECESVEKCKKFLALDHSSRWNALREMKLCRCCLGKHFGPCKSTKLCGENGCTFKHHQLLHNTARDKRVEIAPSQHETAHGSTGKAEHTCNTHRGNSQSVYFQYIPVILHNQGKQISTYAFLDCGSSLTLIEESLASELRLHGRKHPLCLRWTADTCRYEESATVVALDISGSHETNEKHRLGEVYTVRDLKLPVQSLPFNELSVKHRYLQDLPVDSYMNIQPRILIGMNNVRLIHPLESREGDEHEPVAARTRLGWMVFGTWPICGVSSPTDLPHSFHICHHSDESDYELNSVVKQYFTLDSLGIMKPQKVLLSSEDERAIQLMQTSTKFEAGRYQTALLWKHDDIQLPNSKPMALRRHNCLVKRMHRDPPLAAAMHSKMNEYLRKGYIRKLSIEELQDSKKRVWYLPIFPVFNPNKPNKIRVVWDAAATVGETSLNSVLMKGPDLLNDLPSVLYRFRERPVAVSGDIAEMFLRVKMNETDQHCQRIFWCDEDGSTAEYVVTVMTFGAKCSPSCAQFIINHNASKFKSQFSEAVEVIQKGHYVDDMLASVDSEEEAIKLATDVHYIHEQGGFTMRNWVSNSSAVIEALGETGSAEKSLNVDKDAVLEKILGMWWDTKTDTFCYKLSLERYQDLLSGHKHPTKRDILRVMMSVYDPLGLLSHYMIYLKLLFQEIWREGILWDDEIGEKQLQKWKCWLRLLPDAESTRIPRCYNLVKVTERIELHTFVDASELGYAAVSYFRFVEGKQVICSLVGSKVKVAPLKFVSIPRLELQAAVIGTRLAKSIENGHSIQITRRYFWTDARDVICWLRSDHRKYSQFVAFRVGEILEASDVTEWNWLQGKNNVADEGTKWTGLPNFDIRSRWFSGPPFLSKPDFEWRRPVVNEETAEELRPRLLHHSACVVENLLAPENYSSWTRLQRVTAWVQRFPSNIRRKVERQNVVRGPLTSEELRNAENFLYKRAQYDGYMQEMEKLTEKGNTAGKPILPKTSSLYKTNPFVDGMGVMRIRSRIDVCDFADIDTQFPVVLPRGHPITKLVLQNIHETYHHTSHEAFVNESRRKFYIPRVRAECDKVRRHCQRCKNRRANPEPPMMANLPKERLAAYVRPFSYVGVDYFGPYVVNVGRRTDKRWGVLITCLTTRAIHIEIAHSLSTDSCVMALQNCFARRGTPLQIVSDRGTNFIGASKELREALKNLDKDRISAEFTTESTAWIFNPPSSPHMGGVWERMIQTVKRILMQIKPSKRLPNDETLRNYLAEVENIVNSRPLTHVPLDDESSPALTPNHFLVGSSNGSKPLIPYDDSPISLQQSWKTSQVLANCFWKRWIVEYMPTITRRSKWFYPVKPVAIGDIVIIVDSSFPRNCWPKGKVIAVKMSKDGQVRSATVQTISGIYDKPVVKLAVLDIGTNGSKPDQDPVTGGDCCERPS